MVWCIIAAIIAVICLIPVGVELRFGEDGLTVKLAVSAVRIRLYPLKKKTGKSSKQKKADVSPAEKTASQKKKEPAKDAGGSLLDFLPLVHRGLDLLNDFRKKLRVNDLYLRVILSGNDPADLAVNYGKAQAALYSLQPALERVVMIQRRDLEIECDFTSSDTKVAAAATVTITVGAALLLTVIHGYRILAEYLRIRKKRKDGKKNESKAS